MKPSEDQHRPKGSFHTKSVYQASYKGQNYTDTHQNTVIPMRYNLKYNPFSAGPTLYVRICRLRGLSKNIGQL